MSIENLKKLLDSEREGYTSKFDKWNYNEALKKNEYEAGNKDMENRLLPLLQKAVDMAEGIESCALGGLDFKSEKKYYKMRSDFAMNSAREFLSEFTKLTEIKKEDK